MRILNIEIGNAKVFEAKECYGQYWIHIDEPEMLFVIFEKNKPKIYDKMIIYFDRLQLNILDKMISHGFNNDKYEVKICNVDEGQESLFYNYVKKNWTIDE